MIALVRTRFKQFHSLIKFVFVGLLTFTLVVGQVFPVWGQFAPTNLLVPDSNKLPAKVQRFGAIEVAAVTLEGEKLFEVVSPTVWDRSNPGKLIPVEVRAELIEANLNRVIFFEQDPAWDALGINSISNSNQHKGYYTKFDPKTLQVLVAKLKGATAIVATDAHRSQPLQLLTITALDADYYGRTIEELAQQRRLQIDQKLSQKLKERLPVAIQQQMQAAVFSILGMIGISLLLWVVQRFVQAKDKVLAARQEAQRSESIAGLETVTPNTTPASLQHEFFDSLQIQFSLEQRRSLTAFLQWIGKGG